MDSCIIKLSLINSMIKLGRVGVKTGRDGNIRSNCETLN
ncbi:unnamed protein product [Brassica oleracea var. botrytis]